MNTRILDYLSSALGRLELVDFSFLHGTEYDDEVAELQQAHDAAVKAVTVLIKCYVATAK